LTLGGQSLSQSAVSSPDMSNMKTSIIKQKLIAVLHVHVNV